jgi:hypothetical protein
MNTHCCKYCGKSFQSTKKNAIFCSLYCFRENRKTEHWENRVCQHCGKVFKFLSCINKFQPNNGKFCSDKCYHESNRAINICAKCGKEFDVWRCKSGRKYCGSKCAGIAKTEPIKCICKICGKAYYVNPSRAKITKCCSMKCQFSYVSRLWGYDKIKSTKKASQKSMDWKIKNNHRLSTKEWETIRRSVIERDGGRCTQCGNTKSLIVHHVIPWLVCKNDNENNLITLCRPCHYRIEKGALLH